MRGKTITAAMLLFLSLSLIGCGGKRELPENEGAAGDRMLESPCACQEIEYDGAGYRWGAS